MVTNIQTEVNGGRYEAYCDGVTVKNDNFGARDLAAFGIESIYNGNSLLLTLKTNTMKSTNTEKISQSMTAYSFPTTDIRSDTLTDSGRETTMM